MTQTFLSPPMRIAGRVFAVVLAAIVVVAVAAAVWIGVRGVMAYGHLTDAQDAASMAQESLADPAKAADAISTISVETAAARSLTSDPVWQAAESLPWIGPQLGAVSTVAASIDDVAGQALTPLLKVASSFSVASLKPVGGRVDLAPFTELQDAAATGASGIAGAVRAVDEIDTAALIGPVRSGVNDVSALLSQVEAGAGALARTTALLPAMLGADGPRNYLVLFQNNAEWRSLGGNPGAIALLHTDGGALSLAAQESTSDYPTYDGSVIPLSPEVLSIYKQRPGKWMQNVTQVPDFAVSAALASEMWAREHDGQRVDGVIALDPVALSYLLEATGPITLPTGDVLTSENAVQLMLNEVYLRYEQPADQDAFFASAAAAVFTQLAGGDVDPAALVSALVRAGEDHRLLLWSAHADDQALLADTTLAGSLPVTDGDAARFGVYLNDGTGSKMDFYGAASTTVAWEQCSTSSAGTEGTAELDVTIANNAPMDAANLPDYITGGAAHGVALGNALTVAYVYLPVGFELASATLSTGAGFGGGMHDGRRVVSFSVELAPGESATATVQASTTAPGADTLEVTHTPLLTPAEPSVATCGG